MTIEQIQKFQVHEICLDSSSCQHRCTIVLKNGRVKTIRLTKNSIYPLLLKLKKDQVECLLEKEHFKCKSHTVEIEQIISSLFSNLSKSKSFPV